MIAKQSGRFPSQASSGLANLSVVHPYDRQPSASRADGLVDSVISMIWRRRAMVIAYTLLTIPLALVYLVCATPLYTSSASLLLQHNALKLLHDGTPEAAAPDNNDFLYTQQRVITSTPVLAAALASPGVRDTAVLRGQTNGLAILRKGVSVDVGKKDQLITVSFDSARPNDGVLLVSAIVNSYMKFNASLRQDSSNEILQALKQEKAQRTAEIVQQSKELLAFGEAHGVSSNDGKGDVNAQRLQALSDALTAARLARVDAQSEFDQITTDLAADPVKAKKVEAFAKSSGTMLPSSADDALIRQQMLALKAKQVELEQTFMPNHPAVVALQRRIDELDIAYAAGVKHRLNAALVREADLQKSFDEQQKVRFERASAQDEYNRRAAEVDGSRKLIEVLDTRIKEAALTEDGGIPSVTTIDPPRASDYPTKPDKARMLLLAMLAGFAAGSAIAIGKEWGQVRVTTQSVSISLGVPVIGELPLLTPQSNAAAHGQPLLIDTSSQVSEACRQLHEALSVAPPVGR
ncbi:MAG: hypothetical protein JO353_01365, partial [Phycisphaerae bacterium]|nr:hypothetical protein [Phycisphaerae bacterium]